MTQQKSRIDVVRHVAKLLGQGAKTDAEAKKVFAGLIGKSVSLVNQICAAAKTRHLTSEDKDKLTEMLRNNQRSLPEFVNLEVLLRQAPKPAKAPAKKEKSAPKRKPAKKSTRSQPPKPDASPALSPPNSQTVKARKIEATKGVSVTLTSVNHGGTQYLAILVPLDCRIQ